MVGYRIWIPEDPKTRALFLAKVKMSMYAIHQAGIVHMDFYLYPSNIMLREVGYGVVVKIIDWDAVHDVNESLVDKFNHVGQEFRSSLFSKWRSKPAKSWNGLGFVALRGVSKEYQRSQASKDGQGSFGWSL